MRPIFKSLIYLVVVVVGFAAFLFVPDVSAATTQCNDFYPLYNDNYDTTKTYQVFGYNPNSDGYNYGSCAGQNLVGVRLKFNNSGSACTADEIKLEFRKLSNYYPPTPTTAAVDYASAGSVDFDSGQTKIIDFSVPLDIVLGSDGFWFKPVITQGDCTSVFTGGLTTGGAFPETYAILSSNTSSTSYDYNFVLFGGDGAPNPDEAIAWLAAPDIGQTFVSGSKIKLKIRTDIPVALNFTDRITYGVHLEKYDDVTESWVDASVALDGTIYAGKYFIQDDATAKQDWFGVPLFGGDESTYYGFGEWLKVDGTELYLDDGLYRVSANVQFEGHSASPYSTPIQFGVATSGYDGIIGTVDENPDDQNLTGILQNCPVGLGWLCDFVRWLLVPPDLLLDSFYSSIQRLGDSFPVSFLTDGLGAFQTAFGEAQTSVGTASWDFPAEKIPNLAWIAQTMKNFYGDWGEPFAATLIWLAALGEVTYSGQRLLRTDE